MSNAQHRRERWWLGAMVGSVALLTVTVIVANRGVTAAELREVQQQQNDATLCLMLQLNDHRANSYAADKRSVEQHGDSLVLPAPRPPLLDPTLYEAACDRVLERAGATSTRG